MDLHRRAVASALDQVQRAVDQLVRDLVLFARDVADLELAERRDAADRLRVERDQVRMFDLVLAPHLLDHQLGIGEELDVVGFARQGDGQRLEEAGVLGDVVGRPPDRAGESFDSATVWIQDDHAPGGGTGISSRAAVEAGSKPLRH